KVVDAAPADRDAVFFGAEVELENLASGELVRYRIVGPDETDAARGWISIDAPLARAMLKKRVDDEFAARLPGGEARFVIVEVRYDCARRVAGQLLARRRRLFDLRRAAFLLGAVVAFARGPGQRDVTLAEFVQFGFLQFLQVQQRVVGAAGGTDQFVQLDLQRARVAVLAVLDQEHHQEGDDGGAGVDHQLPGVAEAEQRAGDHPDHHRQQRQHEARRAAGEAGTGVRDPREPAPAGSGHVVHLSGDATWWPAAGVGGVYARPRAIRRCIRLRRRGRARRCA